MKKTITANISGIVFHIESDAYDKLNVYLNSIRGYFENTDEVDEIISDIEARIAELLRDMLKNEREVVTTADVDKTIEIMGEPEQFIDVENDFDKEGTYYRSGNFTKKLYRDPDDKVLGGVCSGIGHYFGIDGIWIRIVFLLAFFAYGVGLIPYLIMWIIIPQAKTASDKLKMKGEPVTVDSIGRTIKDEYGRFKKKVDTTKLSQASDKIEHLFTFIAGIIVYIFKFLIKLAAMLVILGTVFALLFVSIGFFAGPEIFNMEINGAEYIFQTELMELIFDNNLIFYFSSIALVLLFAVPMLALLYAAVKLFFNFKGGNKAFGISFGMIWLLSIIMLIISTFIVIDKFSARYSDSQIMNLQSIRTDTLYLASYQPEEIGNWGEDYEKKPIFIKDEKVYLKALSVDVYPSTSNTFQLKIKKKSFGKEEETAEKNVKELSYSYSIEDSLLSINEYLQFPKVNGFRNQEMRISIGIPINKVIYFNESSKNIIFDVENMSDTWDYDMIGHYWKMSNDGLLCLDCEINERGIE